LNFLGEFAFVVGNLHIHCEGLGEAIDPWKESSSVDLHLVQVGQDISVRADAFDPRNARSSSGAGKPLSAASTGSLRTAVIRTLIEIGPSQIAKRLDYSPT
jgi:hypothetical protein